MFTKIKALLTKLQADITGTFVIFFILGILFCGLMVWLGGDENAPKFKKALVVCLVGLTVFLIAPAMVTYFQQNLR